MESSNINKHSVDTFDFDQDIVNDLFENVLKIEKANLEPSFDSHKKERSFDQMVQDELKLIKTYLENKGK